MVKTKPAFKDSAAYNQLNTLIAESTNVIVAHNAGFDIAILVIWFDIYLSQGSRVIRRKKYNSQNLKEDRQMLLNYFKRLHAF